MANRTTCLYYLGIPPCQKTKNGAVDTNDKAVSKIFKAWIVYTLEVLGHQLYLI